MSPLTPTSSLRRTNILHNQILRAAGLRKNMQDSTYKQPIFHCLRENKYINPRGMAKDAYS